MTTEQVWVGAFCAAATALALVALVLALYARRRAQRAESLVAALMARLDRLDSPLAGEPHPAVEAETTAYVITHLDQPSSGEVEVPVARPIDGRLFADIVVRESVVKVASWTHGLRRALSPASRNRIRFEVRQEIRRAGRDRRAETKRALRELRARERAATPGRDVREDVA